MLFRGWGWLPALTALLFAALPTTAGAAVLAGANSGAGSLAASGPVQVVQTTSSLTQALSPVPGVTFGSTPPTPGEPVVTIDDTVAYQRIEGFGAAMTDSSAWLIDGMPSPARAQLMGDLFGPAGLDLSFLRVPIGASDFTATGRPYTYDDLPRRRRDPRLARFSVAHDRAYIIPALLAARALNPNLELLASPWSSPAWMKGNDALNDVAGHGTLRGAAYGPWAAYLVRFLHAYAAAGVPISALTAANEPGVWTRYPGLNMSAASLGIWISRFLVPALAAARLHPKIYGSDLGWGSPDVARAMASGPARSDLTGIAWHCYFGSPDIMAQVHAETPALDEIVTECSLGISTVPVSELLIGSTRNWASAVALWNLALDPAGGPVQPPNTGCRRCSGLVTIDPKSGSLTLRLAWYQLGQASRFVRPGAVRIQSNTFASYSYTRRGVSWASAALDDVAFLNPDGSRVLLAYNNSAATITFAVSWHGGWFQYSLPAGATATFDWPPAG